jgi:maltose O-acetyltransferase
MKNYFLNLVLFFLPSSRFFKFKSFLLSMAGVAIEKNVRVMRIKVLGVKLKIGENTFIGEDTLIMGGKSYVKIGKNCDISSRVNIITGTHKVGCFNRAAGEGYSEDITIEDGVWIGVGATILHGVIIGKGSIVAAGSLVNKSFPSGVLIAGVPAVVKKILYK